MIKGATAALEAAAPETVLGFLANYFPSSELGRPIADFSSSEREDLMEDPMVSLCDDEQVNGALTLDKTMIPYEQLFSWKAESKTTRNVQPIDTKHLRELKVLQALLQRPTDLLKTTRFDVLKFVLKLKCAGFEKELARRIVAAYALLSSEAAAPWLSLPYTIYLSELLSVCTDLMVLWQPNDTFTAKSVLTLVEPEHELGNDANLLEQLYQCASSLGKASVGLVWRRNALCIASSLLKYLPALPPSVFDQSMKDLQNAEEGNLAGWVGLAYIGSEQVQSNTEKWDEAVACSAKSVIFGESLHSIFLAEGDSYPTQDLVYMKLGEVLLQYWEHITPAHLDTFTAEALLALARSLFVYSGEWTQVPKGAFVMVEYIRQLFRQLGEMRRQIAELKEKSLAASVVDQHSVSQGQNRTRDVSHLWDRALGIDSTTGDEDGAAREVTVNVTLNDKLASVAKGIIFRNVSFVNLDALERYFHSLYCMAFGGLLVFCGSEEEVMQFLHLEISEVNQAAKPSSLLHRLILQFRNDVQGSRLQGVYLSGDKLRIYELENIFLLVCKLMQLFRRQSTAINEFLHLDLKELGLRSFVAFIQLEELSLSSLVRNYLYSMVTNYINEFENGDGIACYLLNRHVLETAQTGSVDLNTFLMQMTLLTNIGDRITFPDKMLDQLVYLKDGFINTQEGGVTFIRILRALRMLQWRRDDQFKCVLHNPEVDHEVIIRHLCEGISMLTNLLELGNVYVFKMSTSRALSFCVSVLVEMAKNNPTMLQYLSIQHVTCADTVTNVSTVFGFLNVIYTINDFSSVLVLSQLLAMMLTEVDPASIRSEVRRTCQRSTRERLATKIIDSLKNENEDVDVTRLRLHVLEILIEYNSDLFYDILALKQIEEVSDLPICKTLSDVAKNTKRSLYERATSISLLRKIRVTDVIALKNIIHFFADTAGTTEKVGELYHGAQLLTFLNTAYYHKVKETPTEGDVENTPLGDRRRQRPQQETIETVIRGATAYLHNFLSTYSDAFADITAVEGGEPELPQIQNQTRANNTSTAEIARKKSNTLSTIFARQSLPKKLQNTHTILSPEELVNEHYKVVYPLLLGPLYMFNVDNVALNVCASLLDTAADLLLALETFIRLAGEDSRHHFSTVPLFGLVLNCVALTFKSNRFLGEVMTKYFHSAIQLAACVATTFQPSSVEDISLSKRMASVLTLATLNAKDVSVVSSVLQIVFPFSLEYLLGQGYVEKLFGLVSVCTKNIAEAETEEEEASVNHFYTLVGKLFLQYSDLCPSHYAHSIVGSLQQRLLITTNRIKSHTPAKKRDALDHYERVVDTLVCLLASQRIAWLSLDRDLLIRLLTALSEYEQPTLMDDDGVYYEANWHSLWVTSLKLFQSILLQLRSCTHGHIGEKAADLWITALQQTVVGSKRFLSALEAFTISETQQDFYFTWHLEEILRATEIATLLNTVSSPKPDITRAVQRGFLRLHRYRINRYTMVSAPEKEEEERKRMEEITVEIVGQQLLYFFSRSPLTVTCLGAAPMLVFAPLPNSSVKADVFSPERLTSVYHPYGMGVVCTLNLIREFIKHELLILKSSGEILLNSAVNSRMGSVESTPRGGFVRQAPDMTPPTKDEQTLYKEVHAGIAPQHMRNIKLALSIVCVAAHELVTLQKKMLFEYTTVRQDLAYVLEKLIGLLEGIENNSLGDVDNELARFVSNSRNILTERLRTI